MKSTIRHQRPKKKAQAHEKKTSPRRQKQSTKTQQAQKEATSPRRHYKSKKIPRVQEEKANPKRMHKLEKTQKVQDKGPRQYLELNNEASTHSDITYRRKPHEFKKRTKLKKAKQEQGIR